MWPKAYGVKARVTDANNRQMVVEIIVMSLGLTPFIPQKRLQESKEIDILPRPSEKP